MKITTAWYLSTFFVASVFFWAPTLTCSSFVTTSTQLSPRQAFRGPALRLHWSASLGVLKDLDPLDRNDARCGQGLKLSDSSSIQVNDDEHVLTAMEQILQLVKHNITTPVIVEGCITANRHLGTSFGFIDVVVNERGEIVPLMFKKQDYQGDANGLLKSLNKGMCIRVHGVASATRNPGEGVLLIHLLEIKTLPPNPQHVRRLLRMVAHGRLDVNQVASAANMTQSELYARIQEATLMEDNYDTLAKELLSWHSSKKPKLTQSNVVPIDTKSRRNFPLAPEHLQQVPIREKSIRLNGMESFAVQSISDLSDSLEGQNDSNLVALNTWVQNRQQYRDSITVLGIADTYMAMSGSASTSDAHDDSEANCVPCVLHPDLVGEEAASMYGTLLCAGSRASLEGYVVEQGRTPTLWITSVTLLRCSSRLTIVRHLMELLVAEQFDAEEGANALELSGSQCSELTQMDLTERQWKSTEISQALQGSHTRMSHVTPHMFRTLATFQQLRDDFPEHGEDNLTRATENVADYYEKNLLTTNLPGTWWQRKKRPQLECMGRHVCNVVRSHPDYGTRQLRILDVGGGKGVLANYLAQLLGDAVQLQVIDIEGGAIRNGMMRSKRLDLSSSVKYSVGDASQCKEEADVVVALHACGTLSDVALGHAVNHGASFVVCPCCFRSNPHLLVPAGPDGGNERQFLSVQEWLGVDADDFDTIKSLAEVQGDSRLASVAMHTICAMRAAAVQRHSAELNKSLQVSIKTFPISFSPRNFCLVGTIKRN